MKIEIESNLIKEVKQKLRDETHIKGKITKKIVEKEINELLDNIFEKRY